MKETKDTIQVRGFTYLQILGKDEDGNTVVVGDSGWRKNTVTNHGKNNVCAGAAIAASGSKQVKAAALAQQATTVNATQASLLSATNTYCNTVSPSTVATGKAKCTVSFHGSGHGATITIGSIGLHSTTSCSNELIAGATFATSQFAADQSVNATYQLEFS
jgi:hypothetical protein